MFNFHRKKNTFDGMPSHPQSMNPPHVISVPMSASNSIPTTSYLSSSGPPVIRNELYPINKTISSPVGNQDLHTSNNFYQNIPPSDSSLTSPQTSNVFQNNIKKNHSKISLSGSQIKLSSNYQLEPDREFQEDIDQQSGIQSQSNQSHNQFQSLKSQYPRPNQMKSSTRRVWVRKNNHTATTIAVGPYDIVDDLKYMISQKFPTTLALQFDPSDLIVKLVLPYDSRGPISSSPNTNINFPFQKKKLSHDDSSSPLSVGLNQHSKLLQHPAISDSLKLNMPISPQPMHNTKSSLLPSEQSVVSDVSPSSLSTRVLTLEPDVLVWSVIDRYFPNGMSMSDALVISARVSPVDESFKIDPNMKIQSYQYPNKNYNSRERNEMSLSSYDMNQTNSVNLGSIKTAILGDQKVPPPRLRSFNPADTSSSQTPQSSAVILFPKEIREESKSPTPVLSTFATDPTPPSPKSTKNGNSRPPIQLSESIHTRTDSSELRKRMNLKVNTTTSMDKSSEVEKIHPNDSALSSTPNSESNPVSNIESKQKNNKIPFPTEKKKKKDEKLGISKILSYINVLVVEDNLVNQKIMARHLKSCNVQFQIASTGKEALEMWKKGGFHLCFMDIQLPVMSGIEVTKEIRRLEQLNHIGSISSHSIDSSSDYKELGDVLDLSLFRSPIIIVALTASTGATDQQNALAAGCNDYLTKPVQLKWLKNKLTEWGYMQALINYDYFRNES